jgi:hypothetical protein|tara:strand:- start:11247 stop:11522 length:276 start_codon:yes stop_codon:yes gene_type:complete
MINRSSSTIPFGYKLKEDNKTLEPIEKEINALKEMKDSVKAGAFSLRGAVEILESQTGRKLSAMGLKKIMDKDKPKEETKPSLLSKNDREA